MLISSLSQQYPDLPVLGSLLAGLLLPVHDDNAAAAQSRDDDMTSSVTSSSRQGHGGMARSASAGHLLPIIHGLRPGASVAEVCDRLQELDELSKRHVDVLEHFVVV